MKYNMTARVYGTMFNMMLKSYYKKHFPDINIQPIMKNITKEYKLMIERTPDIGGNSLESDLIGACYFFTLGKVVPNMTPQILDNIIDESIHSTFMQKAHEGKKKKGTLFSDKVQDQKVKEAKASLTSSYEMDWKFDYIKGKDEFYCTYTKCGICTLAKRENIEEYLPCMCKIDYAAYDMVGAKLIRTKTLSNGDECCNFHVVRNK